MSPLFLGAVLHAILPISSLQDLSTYPSLRRVSLALGLRVDLKSLLLQGNEAGRLALTVGSN